MWSTPDEAPVALLRVRRDGSATAANRAWCELTGLSVDQSLAQGWLGFLLPGDHAPVLDAIRRAAATDRAACVDASSHAGAVRCLVRRSTTCSDVVLALVPAPVQAATPATVPARPAPDVVAVIHDLYAVSLGLASCLSQVDGPAGHRISDAIDRLDHVVRRLRTAVIEDRRRAAPGTSLPSARGVPTPRGG